MRSWKKYIYCTVKKYKDNKKIKQSIDEINNSVFWREERRKKSSISSMVKIGGKSSKTMVASLHVTSKQDMIIALSDIFFYKGAFFSLF